MPEPAAKPHRRGDDSAGPRGSAPSLASWAGPAPHPPDTRLAIAPGADGGDLKGRYAGKSRESTRSRGSLAANLSWTSPGKAAQDSTCADLAAAEEGAAKARTAITPHRRRTLNPMSLLGHGDRGTSPAPRDQESPIPHNARSSKASGIASPGFTSPGRSAHGGTGSHGGPGGHSTAPPQSAVTSPHPHRPTKTAPGDKWSMSPRGSLAVPSSRGPGIASPPPANADPRRVMSPNPPSGTAAGGAEGGRAGSRSHSELRERTGALSPSTGRGGGDGARGVVSPHRSRALSLLSLERARSPPAPSAPPLPGSESSPRAGLGPSLRPDSRSRARLPQGERHETDPSPRRAPFSFPDNFAMLSTEEVSSTLQHNLCTVDACTGFRQGPSGGDSPATSFVPIDTSSLTTAYLSCGPSAAATGPVSSSKWSGPMQVKSGGTAGAPLSDRLNPRQDAFIHSDPSSRGRTGSAIRARNQKDSEAKIRSDLSKKEKMEMAVSAAAGSMNRTQAGRVDAAGLSKAAGAERQRKGGDDGSAASGLGGRVVQGLAGAVEAVARMGLAGQGYTSIPQVEMSETAAVNGLHSGSSGSSGSSTVSRLAKRHTEVPQELLCPISMQIMKDPVIAGDGFTYDRQPMEQWLQRSPSSPMTGATLSSRVLVPNLEARQLIKSFLTEKTGSAASK